MINKPSKEDAIKFIDDHRTELTEFQCHNIKKYIFMQSFYPQHIDKVECKYFKKGICKNENFCIYSHIPINNKCEELKSCKMHKEELLNNIHKNRAFNNFSHVQMKQKFDEFKFFEKHKKRIKKDVKEILMQYDFEYAECYEEYKLQRQKDLEHGTILNRLEKVSKLLAALLENKNI